MKESWFCCLRFSRDKSPVSFVDDSDGSSSSSSGCCSAADCSSSDDKSLDTNSGTLSRSC